MSKTVSGLEEGSQVLQLGLRLLPCCHKGIGFRGLQVPRVIRRSADSRKKAICDSIARLVSADFGLTRYSRCHFQQLL